MAPISPEQFSDYKPQPMSDDEFNSTHSSSAPSASAGGRKPQKARRGSYKTSGHGLHNYSASETRGVAYGSGGKPPGPVRNRTR